MARRIPDVRRITWQHLSQNVYLQLLHCKKRLMISRLGTGKSLTFFTVSRTSEIILKVHKNRHEMAEGIWTSAATLDMRCLPDVSITKDVSSCPWRQKHTDPHRATCLWRWQQLERGQHNSTEGYQQHPGTAGRQWSYKWRQKQHRTRHRHFHRKNTSQW